MYKYTDSLDSGIGLHDCRAKKLTLGDGSMTFVFDEGIYVLPENPDNPTGEVCYTDRAEITFCNTLFKAPEDGCTVYLFSDTDDEARSVREEISAQKLADMLDEGMELEFLYTYKRYRSYIFRCWLWFDKEPYHRECELIIAAEETFCRWNELHTEETHLSDRFIYWAKKNGWKITENNKKASLPGHITERYSLPEEWLRFTKKLSVCTAPDEAVWFLTPSDYIPAAHGDNGFSWDSFEKMSLGSAGGEEDIKRIKAFWTVHIPIVMSVRGEYSYYAIDTVTGKVVSGSEPEFEECAEAAECFDEFLCKIITGEIVL